MSRITAILQSIRSTFAPKVPSQSEEAPETVIVTETKVETTETIIEVQPHPTIEGPPKPPETKILDTETVIAAESILAMTITDVAETISQAYEDGKKFDSIDVKILLINSQEEAKQEEIKRAEQEATIQRAEEDAAKSLRESQILASTPWKTGTFVPSTPQNLTKKRLSKPAKSGKRDPLPRINLAKAFAGEE